MGCTIILKNKLAFRCQYAFMDDEGFVAYKRPKQCNILKRIYNKLLRKNVETEDVYFNPEDIAVSIFDADYDEKYGEDQEVVEVESKSMDEYLTSYV